MPDDAERDGSSFTEKITALWPPRRQRTSLPSLERTTVKAHVLAHVARSRGGPRTPAAAASRPRLAHPSAVRIGPLAPLEPDDLDLPLPAPPFPRGSQTTPRIDEDAGSPPGLLAAQPAPEAPPPAAVIPGAAMPPLYAGIVPYRHTLRPGLFELTPAPLAAPVAPAGTAPVLPAPSAMAAPAAWTPAAASAPVAASAPAAASAPVAASAPAALARAAVLAASRRGRTRASVGARALARARPASRLHSVTWPAMLLVAMWWSAAYCQVWHALALTERLRVVWHLLSGLLGR